MRHPVLKHRPLCLALTSAVEFVSDTSSTLRWVSTICPYLVCLARTIQHVNASDGSAQLCRRSPAVFSTVASSRQKARKTSFCNPPIWLSEDEHPRLVLLTARFDLRRNALPDRSASRESIRGGQATRLLPSAYCSVGHQASASADAPSPPPPSTHPGGQAFRDLGLGSFPYKTRDGSTGSRTRDAFIDWAPRQGILRSAPLPEPPVSQRDSPTGGLPIG